MITKAPENHNYAKKKIYEWPSYPAEKEDEPSWIVRKLRVPQTKQTFLHCWNNKIWHLELFLALPATPTPKPITRRSTTSIPRWFPVHSNKETTPPLLQTRLENHLLQLKPTQQLVAHPFLPMPKQRGQPPLANCVSFLTDTSSVAYTNCSYVAFSISSTKPIDNPSRGPTPLYISCATKLNESTNWSCCTTYKK